MEIDLAKRYQTMLTLWFALLMSVVMYFVVTLLAAPEMSAEGSNQPSSLLAIVFTAVGALSVLVSLAVKHKLLDRAVEKGDVGLVQKAMILACALCEVSALLGLVLRLVLGSRGHYLLFLLAAVGMVLHFPRRSQLEAVTWRTIRSSTLPDKTS